MLSSIKKEKKKNHKPLLTDPFILLLWLWVIFPLPLVWPFDPLPLEFPFVPLVLPFVAFPWVTEATFSWFLNGSDASRPSSPKIWLWELAEFPFLKLPRGVSPAPIKKKTKKF